MIYSNTFGIFLPGKLCINECAEARQSPKERCSDISVYCGIMCLVMLLHNSFLFQSDPHYSS